MSFFKVVLTVLMASAYATAIGYGGGAGNYGGGGAGNYGGGGAGNYGGGGAGNYGSGMNQPKPYNFEYQARDEQGNVHFRTEKGDGSGAVHGSYGYTDQQGLYRKVEYVADQQGYRAQVKTNEPGVDGKENPADVIMNADKPPSGIQDRYTRMGGYGGHQGFGSMGGGMPSFSGSGKSGY